MNQLQIRPDRRQAFLCEAEASIAHIADSVINVKAMLMHLADTLWYGATVGSIARKAQQLFGLDFARSITPWLRSLEARYKAEPVFTADEAAALQSTCAPPAAVLPDGTQVWSRPAPSPSPSSSAPGRVAACRGHAVPAPSRYVVTVDIGGNSPKSDFSVIAAFDRQAGPDGNALELISQWRGHTKIPRLLRKAESTARKYQMAELIIESNSLESGVCFRHRKRHLRKLARRYPNLYRRPGGKIGFHTNRASKLAAISALRSLIQNKQFIERSHPAALEAAKYIRYPSGTLGAPPGLHDDLLVTRLLAAHRRVAACRGHAIPRSQNDSS